MTTVPGVWPAGAWAIRWPRRWSPQPCVLRTRKTVIYLDRWTVCGIGVWAAVGGIRQAPEQRAPAGSSGRPATLPVKRARDSGGSAGDDGFERRRSARIVDPWTRSRRVPSRTTDPPESPALPQFVNELIAHHTRAVQPDATKGTVQVPDLVSTVPHGLLLWNSLSVLGDTPPFAKPRGTAQALGSYGAPVLSRVVWLSLYGAPPVADAASVGVSFLWKTS